MSKSSKDTSHYTFPFIVASTLAIGVMIGIRVSDNKKGLPLIDVYSKAEPFQALGRVEELLRFIEAKYVDSIDTDTLVDDAIYALLDNLDPHSAYLNPSEVRDIQNQMEGHYRGLGVETIIVRDTPTIYRVLEASPAQKAKLLTGDQILQIDQEKVAGASKPFHTIRDLLQKTEEQSVPLTIKRGKDIVNVNITLDEVSVPGVSCGYLIGDSIVYIKIDRFGEKTYQEFMQKLEALVGEQAEKHLLLDLRGNPGGYLPEATNILCQIFEDKDKILVTTKTKNQKTYTYKSTGKRFFPIKKVVVLVDENSASASEIIAGALQDWDRGTIVGRRTFGKGLVQEQYDLSNGGAIRLTVAKYYTPSGRSIQRDYQDKNRYENDWNDRIENGDFFKLKAQDQATSQTKFASLVKGRKLASNGGIFPDIFVPADSAFLTSDFLKMEDRFIEYFLIHINSPLFTGRKTVDEIRNFSLSEEAFQTFLHFCEVDDLHKPLLPLKTAAEKYFKLVLASAYLPEEEIIKLDNSMDLTYLRSLEVFSGKMAQ